MPTQSFPGRPLAGSASVRLYASHLVLLLVLLPSAGPALAAGDSDAAAGHPARAVKQWTIQTSLYTRHWDPQPEHNNQQRLLGLEALFHKDWLVGAAVFRNSFEQSSQLIYAGKRWALFDSPHGYVKLVGGLAHGYKGPYKDKIPLNGLGIAPVLLPSVGFEYNHFMLEVTLAGAAAMTITAGISF